MELTQPFVAELSRTKNYQNFLKKAFTELERSKNGFSYADFARKAGFSSRSFPRDVVLGKKRLTASSAIAFANALKLRGDLKQFFVLLVEVQGDGIAASPTSLEKAKKQLNQVRQRLVHEQRDESKKHTLFTRTKYWFEVYAALGTLERGASLDAIERRTNLSSTVCKNTLTEMVQQGVARFDAHTNIYYPTESHLITDQLGKNDGFKTMYLESLKRLEKRALESFDSSDELFFYSAFSIQGNKMNSFRAELRELILQFVDQNETPEGDKVVKLTLGFT